MLSAATWVLVIPLGFYNPEHVVIATTPRALPAAPAAAFSPVQCAVSAAPFCQVVPVGGRAVRSVQALSTEVCAACVGPPEH